MTRNIWSLNDIKLLKKIFDLIASIKRNPVEGIGKPEALKGNLKGSWSRRINEEHRIVYCITNDAELLFLAEVIMRYKKEIIYKR